MKKIKLNIQKFAGSTFDFASSGYLQGRIIWNSTSNGSIANSSNVSATIQIHRTNSATTTGTFSGNLNINGDNRNWSWYGSISSNWVSVFSFSTTVGHNSDGSKVCYIGGSVNGPSGTSLSGNTSSGSQNVTLDKIDRFAIITNAPNFNDEENPTITFTNYNKVFSLRAKIEAGGNTQLITRDLSKTATSCTFNLTEEERNKLRKLSTNSNNLSVRFTICSMQGNTELSPSYLDRNMSIINANPTFSNFEFEDINSKTLALTGNSKYNINGYSTIRAIISTSNKAIAKKSATITKYNFKIDNLSKEANYSDDSTVNIDILNSTSGTYNLYAIDSRNNTTLVTKLAEKEIKYTDITFDSLNCVAKRDNNGVGENAILTYSGAFWQGNFGKKENQIISASYEFKKTTDPDSKWITGKTSITPIIDGNKFTFSDIVASDKEDTSFDLDISYDFRITISDELSSKSIQLSPMGNARPHIAFADNGIGFMGVYDEQKGGSVQIDSMPIYFIVEQINNSDGSAIKFSNGVMICYGEKSFSYSTGDYYAFCNRTDAITISFPVEFLETPIINLTSETFEIMSFNIYNVTKTKFVAYGLQPKNSSQSSGKLDYIAIGKWK